ncbi:putative mitochondrial protein [Cucumis melo var. makuwa]|uniref:Mitochondrial protein n=1 Tax=Cucumis melo var. makuwa TaxID=1194695 RepID=A0A5A7T5N2_CUCMM|nr:putative mitochondrial protein [Cucumis melo var. makuwa]TYK31535.1 putative mitochondrial protein [Cucumis melo var. makuwa]
MSIIGELSCFLGIFISHEKYAKNIVKKFELDKSQQKRTPAVTHVKITKDSDGDTVDNKLYRSMIGSLHYLTTSRRDVAYIVGVCARFQSNPRVSHLVTIKRIIKYVNGTSDFGVLYSYNMNSILVDYYDADWAGCLEVRKSTSEGCFFLGKYQARSTKIVAEGTSSRTNMHGVRMRGHQFKSVLYRRPYRSERVPSESHLSDMDSNERDDVPLARLLKHGLTRKSSHPSANDPIAIDAPCSSDPSVHSSSSSSLNVFISTPRHQPIDVHIENIELDVNNPPTDNNPNVGIPASKSDLPPADPKQKSKKSKKGPRVVTTKTGQRKLIKEFIVNLPSEFNGLSSPDYQNVHIRGSMFKISHAIINGFLGNSVVSGSQSSHPSNDELASVLSGGTLSIWAIHGIPVVPLSVKYDILHKIGIASCHVPDLEHDMRPSRNPRAFDINDKIGVGALVHHLKSLIPSSSAADQSQE